MALNFRPKSNSLASKSASPKMGTQKAKSSRGTARSARINPNNNAQATAQFKAKLKAKTSTQTALSGKSLHSSSDKPMSHTHKNKQSKAPKLQLNSVLFLLKNFKRNKKKQDSGFRRETIGKTPQRTSQGGLGASQLAPQVSSQLGASMRTGTQVSAGTRTGAQQNRASRPRRGNQERRPQARPASKLFSQLGFSRLAIIGILICVIVCGAAYTGLMYAPFLRVTQVQAQPTEHLSQDEILRLAQIGDSENILRISTRDIVARIKENPWVEKVEVSRHFPHTLNIAVTERQVPVIAVVKGGQEAWYIGIDGTWIQPLALKIDPLEQAKLASAQASAEAQASAQEKSGSDAADSKNEQQNTKQDNKQGNKQGNSSNNTNNNKNKNSNKNSNNSGNNKDSSKQTSDQEQEKRSEGVSLATPEQTQQMQASSLLGQAQKQAEQEGRIFIFNVEENLVPKAGEHLPDGALSACIDYITGFSQNLVPLIKEMTCPNKSSVGARLRNGVSLSLGAPKDASDISLKESVILALLKEHEHEITYINVRVPNQPAWRGLGSTGAANVKQESENAKQNSAEQTGGNQAGASN